MESLVDGPLGTAVVATLGNVTPTDYLKGKQPDESYSDSLATDTRVLLEHVGAVIEGFAYGSSSEWREVLSRESKTSAAYAEMAKKIETLTACKWWWSHVDLTNQAWFGPSDAMPVEKFSSIKDRDDDPNLWWVEPWGAFATSRRLESGESVTRLCRDGHTSMDESASNAEIPIQFPPGVKVFEVSCAQDWVDLTRRFPKRLSPGRMLPWSQWTGYDGSWIVPDWRSVAEECDGVHVQLGAFLSAAYKRLAFDEGSTMLVGWNPDSTLWLR